MELATTIAGPSFREGPRCFLPNLTAVSIMPSLNGSRSIQVHKFGGAALAESPAIERAADIVRRNQSAPCVVVTSALAGVTDALLVLAQTAARADNEGRSQLTELGERHRAVWRDIAGDAGTDGSIERRLAELDQIVARVQDTRSLTPAARDEIVSFGERLAAEIFAAALTKVGVQATVVDATDVVQTDSRFGHAAPDLGRTTTAARERLLPLLEEGRTVVVPGFFGATPDGAVATLGRGGSDLTATVLARALGARDVYLWKDVPGILSANPRLVPGARVIAQLHTREAAELAYYGAKVLHPRALIPLDRDTRVYIRPFASPDDPGTEISGRRPSSGSPVRALSAIDGQALVTVSGNGMLGVPGIAARTFGALAQAGISVSLISQASSEHSICFAVPETEAKAAHDRLLEAFADELRRHEIDSVDLVGGVSTIAVVGSGMVHTPGVAARIFTALADASINVIAIAQGSSELNISVVVEAARAADAQRAIHRAFQLDKRGGGSAQSSHRRDVILLGFGRIGRELASHIGASSATTRSRLRIVAVIDRSGYLFDTRGLSDRRLALAAREKAQGRDIAAMTGGMRASAHDAVVHVLGHALSRPLLVDAAAGDTSAVVLAAVEHGVDIVMANKVPLASDHRTASNLLERAKAHGRRVLHEATVGAGLPIIDTLEKLVASGDRVLTVEGCPSGTLGYLFGELGRGTSFSTALGRAMTLGYTEPDPRDDLSGMDVARKALILGRLLGFHGDLDDVNVESLVPESLRDVPLSEFLSRLEEMDALWAERVDAARARGEVLRYRAIATRRSVRVGLVSVRTSSPLAALEGTDNQFAFTTTRYRENPLIITGPGAGPAVTAAGVLNDVLRLAESHEPRVVRRRDRTKSVTAS
jgi:aspartokinase/homoserine dehydrogenase 1